MTLMTGRTYDFWLLDLDGTVVDIEQPYIHEVFADVGDRLGRSFADHEAERLWYGIGDARTELLDGIDRQQFWDVFHAVEDPLARADSTYVYEDAAEFVTGLDAPVGIVTHCQEFLTEPILDRLDIADWFDTVVCCSETLGWKPDPRPVEVAMGDLGVRHNGHVGVMVGDDPTDVEAGHNAGLDGIRITRQRHRWHEHEVGGEWQVSALTDLGG